MRVSRLLSPLIGIAILPQTAFAQITDTARGTGVSALWLLSNFCYAGMRAQGHPSAGWRILAFVFGFPGTLLSLLVVDEGGQRVYGVDAPVVNRHAGPKAVPADFDV